MLRITLLVCLATRTLAQLTKYSPCPSVKVVTDFDGPRYMGTWYETEKYEPGASWPKRCVSADYSLNENGTVTVQNSETRVKNGVRTTTTGLGRFNGDPSEAKLTVHFSIPPVEFDMPYWIIATDYDNWAAVWSCTDIDSYSIRFAWIMTRRRNPTFQTIALAYDAFDANKIDRRLLSNTDQRYC